MRVTIKTNMGEAWRGEIFGLGIVTLQSHMRIRTQTTMPKQRPTFLPSRSAIRQARLARSRDSRGRFRSSESLDDPQCSSTGSSRVFLRFASSRLSTRVSTHARGTIMPHCFSSYYPFFLAGFIEGLRRVGWLVSQLMRVDASISVPFSSPTLSLARFRFPSMLLSAQDNMRL